MKYRWQFVGLMSGMTVATVNACQWQYSKYQVSVAKWQQVEQCLEEQRFYDYPALMQLIRDKGAEQAEFSLLRLQGHFLADSVQSFARTYHNRFGRQVFAIFQQEGGQKVMVNVGWVEKDFPLQDLQLPSTRVEGVVRLARESKEASKKYLLKDGVNESISLRPAIEEHKMASIVVEQTQGEEQEQLYPLQPTVESFERPYLTPDKHRDYALFWAACSAIGVFSIASAIL